MALPPPRVVVDLEKLRNETRIHLEHQYLDWEALSVHDVSTSESMAAWADVVICEWAGPNAVWYSRNKRPGQRLIVRLHRFELDGGVKHALDGIRGAARAGQNVMPALVDGALAKCTLGEMVQAMADVYGRYSGGPEW